MASMGAKDHVGVIEVRTDSGRDCFLSDVSMACAVNETSLMGFGQPLLASADQQHGAQQLQLSLRFKAYAR